MKFSLYRFRTAISLGVRSISRYFIYRLAVGAGFFKIKTVVNNYDPKHLFYPVHLKCFGRSTVISENRLSDSVNIFGIKEVDISSAPPIWHQDILTGKTFDRPNKDWWEISDFELPIGDIKKVWELSRLCWVPRLAYLGTRNGVSPQQSVRYLNNLNLWLKDWVLHNSPYKGVNWKCGQEASIRLMQLVLALQIINSDDKLEPDLVWLIKVHLNRIRPTILYAISQDNNHGTSEAAALFVGGEVLIRAGDSAGDSFSKLGRKWLEERVEHLIESDGTFSQYSVNYHRMVLDTLSFVETTRRWLSSRKFSSNWYKKARSASVWLASVVDEDNGYVPNIGANDGALLFQLTNADHRDFRPSVFWAYSLFLGGTPWEYSKMTSIDLAFIERLGVSTPRCTIPTPKNANYSEGGFILLNNENGARVVIKYPSFRFRPSQNDILHVDLWLHGENLLRDAGSYSYNCDEPWQSYFPSVEAHNTVQFDERDQMPRLSRFLLGAWPKSRKVNFIPASKGGSGEFAAQYTDYRGASHYRKVKLSQTRLIISDQVSGFENRAVVRYRLTPTRNWQVDDNGVSDGEHKLLVSADVPISSLRLVDGWESLYYLKKTKVPVLEVEIQQSGSLTMEYQWA
ncbi:heparinase II/III-family protein [Pseudidiomarina sp. 1APP75-27a]|uniref:heparinase II/III family protein n=1 Tax=Pseudidiomarina terrestris TaxID=2820060 RepID=UPI002B0610FF|nr:heparinase II/III-family protein [Pseudidiomarina sp. 1APP75-27a]MEA3587667.1 heparinase II/III-family protein [Pseudidiomarina sp. 1APP75-27a]